MLLLAHVTHAQRYHIKHWTLTLHTIMIYTLLSGTNLFNGLVQLGQQISEFLL